MPNEGNIVHPITVIGIGRSGTTLLQACFQAHPDVQALNETGGLIFGLAAGAFECPLPSKARFANEYEYAGYVIRETLLAIEPSKKPFWFHKPIGLPKLVNWCWQEGQRTSSGFPVEWYWKVLLGAFPEAIYIFCLRNPWDVVLSWQRFAGWEQVDIWRDIADAYEAIEMGWGRLRDTYFFEDFIDDPELVLMHMCRSIGVQFHSSMLTSFEERQAMRPEDTIMRDYRSSWDDCVDPSLSHDDAEKIVKIWKLNGRHFDSPRQHRDLFVF
jgi:hypothetical protein